MPSPINGTALGIGTAINVVSTTEIVAAVSAGVNCDNVQTQVSLSGSIDFLNSSTGTSVTLKIRRGNGITGTLITNANTWGPFTLVASNRVNFNIDGSDIPGLVGGQVYSLTVTVAGNSGTPVIEVATLQAFAMSQS